MTGPLTEALNLVLNAEPGIIHVTALRAIFKTDNALDVYAHLLKNVWSTTREVRDALDIPGSTAYRVIASLEEAGAIIRERYKRERKKEPRPCGGGPRETVWRLNDEL